MPITIQSDSSTNNLGPYFKSALGKDYSYEYPDGLDLQPTSELHGKLLNAILSRATLAKTTISRFYDTWKKADNTLKAYIDLQDYEQEIKKTNPNLPISIVVPYSYAVLDTMLSYMMNAFVQDPIFRYEGTGPEDTIGAVLLEQVIAKHCTVNKVGLNLHTLFRDSFTYGFGVVSPYWKVSKGKRRVKKHGILRDFLGRVTGKEPVTQTEDVITFEGNALENIDPYAFLPDPTTPIHEIQNSEYFGWTSTTNLMDLLQKDEEEYFNCKYLRHVNTRSALVQYNESNRRRLSSTIANSTANPVDVLTWYQKLVPSYWGLGDSDQPQIWLFEIANDVIIINATQVELDHGMFPIASTCPEYDGHSALNISRIELVSGLQTVLNFMFNSHVSNVRRTVNNTLVVDPYLVNIDDITNPKSSGGGIIRMRRAAFGKGVEGAVKQLQVNDVTRQHIGDSSYISDIMDRTTGTSGATMGFQRRGGPERVTGKEFEGTQQGAFTRMERVARVLGLQAMQDIGTLFARHTQQFMSREIYVKTVGELENDVRRSYGKESQAVSVFDLLVDFDVIVRDGSVPGGNFSGAWLNMFEMITRDPELRQNFDVPRLAGHIFRNLGAKNAPDFIKIVPDQQVQQQVQAGNFAPVQGAGI